MAVVVSLTKEKILSLIPSMEEMKEWLEDNLEIVDPIQFEELRQLLEQTRQELAQTGQDLDTRLQDARAEIEAAELRLAAAEARLVAAEAELGQASDWIAESGEELKTKLEQALLDLTQAQSDLNELETVTLPALQTQLADNAAEMENLETIVLPALQEQLGDNETAIAELVETTLPALNTRLGDNETAITDAETTLNAAFPSGVFDVRDLVEAAAADATSANLLIDGDFELGLTQDDNLVEDPSAFSGTHFLRFPLATYANCYMPWTPIVPGTVIALSAFARKIGTGAPGTFQLAVRVEHQDGSQSNLFSGDITDQETATTEWKRYVSPNLITIPATAVRMRGYIVSAAGTGTGTLDVDFVAAYDVSAMTKAQEAILAADAAMATANGKNLSTYSNIAEASKPGPAPTITEGRRVGDTHRNRNQTTGEVYAEWMFGAAGTWQPANFGDSILRSLDVGKITGGSAAFDTFVADKVTARVASIIELNANRITSGTINTDRLNTNQIAAAVATVIELNASRITAGTINTDRLNTNQIAAAVATVIELNANRITAGTINTDRLNTNQIAAAVANVIELNANRITSGTINTNRLNANEVAGAIGTFLRLTAENLYVPGTTTMHSTIVNEIWAQAIRSRKITADMLVVGSGVNLIVDPTFTNTELCGYRGTLSSGSWTAITASPYGGTNRFRLNNSTTGVNALELRQDISGALTTIDPDETYRFKFRAVQHGSGVASARAAVRYRRADGTLAFVSVMGYAPVETDLTKIGVAWHEGTWTAPADAVEAAMTVQVDGAANFVDIVSPSFTVSGASLIVDGTLSSRHINVTGALTARIAQIIELDVERLTATGTSTLKSAVIENLWTNVVRARKISTDMLVVGRGENLIGSPYFYDSGKGWTQGANQTYRQSGGYAGTASLLLSASSSQVGAYFGTANAEDRSSVDPGETYRFSAYAMCDTGSIGAGRAALFVRWFNGVGLLLSTSSHTSTETIPQNTHGEVEAMFTAPANAAYAAFGLYSQSAHNAPMIWSHPYFVRATSASLIVDGSIAARHIIAEAISGEKIQALTIEANHIKAGAITTAKLQATAIDGMTITGAHIRTSAAPWSGGGIRMLGSRFTMWDSTNRQRVDFNPDTNDFIVTGILEATNASGQGVQVRPPTSVYGGWLDFQDPTLNTGAYIATGGTSAVSTERGTLTLVSASTTANQRRGRIRLEPNGGVMIGAAPLGTASAERQYLNMTPNSHIRFFNDDTNVGIQMGSAGSTGVQIQTSGTTQLWVQTDMFRAPSIWNNTSSGTANIAIYSNNGGEVRRVTSLSKYKLDQRGLDPQDASDAFMALDPVSWVDRGEHDRGEDPRRYLGFIAEQVAEVEKNYGLEGMTVYDEDGELASVSYDRLLALAVHAIRILNTRVEQLEAR